MSELESKKVSSDQNPTRISWKASYKANMGNFETLGLEAGVETTARSGENVVDALERVYGVVEAALLVKVREIKEQLSKIEKETSGGTNNEAEGS